MSKLKRVYGCISIINGIEKCSKSRSCWTGKCRKPYYLVPVDDVAVFEDTKYGSAFVNDEEFGTVLWIPAKKEKKK